MGPRSDFSVILGSILIVIGFHLCLRRRAIRVIL